MSDQGKVQVVAKPKVEKPEGIRDWYNRTTSKARKLLVWSTLGAIIGAFIAFLYLSPAAAARLQTFNGALTIPISALIWIMGFIYIFLVPQREAGFRSQEWIEMMVATFQDAMVTKISPAIKVWTRVGERIDSEFPEFLETAKATFAKANETMDALQSAARKIEVAVEKNEQVVEDARPMIESLKRIEGKIEYELKSGFLEDIRIAAHSVRTLGGLPPVGPKSSKDDEDPVQLDWALQTIRKNKEKKA